MSTPPEGFYDGKIKQAYVVVNDKNQLDLCVEIIVPELADSFWSNQRCYGEYEHIAKEVVEHLELTYPDDLADMSAALGQEVRVRIKHNVKGEKTYVNCYIVTKAARKPAEPSDVAAAIAEMKAKLEKKDLPF